MKKFGIVIPSYNQSRFLPDALESLRSQSVSFELAVADGGSTDGFQAAVAPYKRMITWQRSAPDDGQAAAIREGLSHLSGDVVAWLNADDYYFPETLEKVAAVLDSRPDVDVVYGDAVHVNAGGMFHSYFLPAQDFDRQFLTRHLFICQPACFVRRSAYEHVGGVDTGLHYTMDWDLWCRLAAEGAVFSYLPQPLAAVRVHPETKTLSGHRRRYREIFRVERRYGKRPLPRSWVGAYWYQLSQHSDRNRFENTLFRLLDRLRPLSKRFQACSGLPTHYGFHRWEKRICGTAVIHLPWYGDRSWNALRLRLTPSDCDYAVAVNGGAPVVGRALPGGLKLPVERPTARHMRVEITSLGQTRWWLESFDCEF